MNELARLNSQTDILLAESTEHDCYFAFKLLALSDFESGFICFAPEVRPLGYSKLGYARKSDR